MSATGIIYGRTADVYQSAFHALDITSDPMKQAISDWYNLRLFFGMFNTKRFMQT